MELINKKSFIFKSKKHLLGFRNYLNITNTLDYKNFNPKIVTLRWNFIKDFSLYTDQRKRYRNFKLEILLDYQHQINSDIKFELKSNEQNKSLLEFKPIRIHTGYIIIMIWILILFLTLFYIISNTYLK